MTHLSEQDYQKILGFLHGLYAVDCLNNFSDSISSLMLRLVPGDVGGYCKIDLNQNQLLEGTALPPLSNVQVRQVTDDYFHEHPLLAHYMKSKDVNACKLSDFVSEQQLHRMEGLYHKFLQPMGMKDQFVMPLPDPTFKSVESMNLFREERSFTDRDRTILNLLQPHLMQARQTANALTHLHQSQQQARDCLNAAGCVVLSSDGQVHTMTQKAETLLKRYFSDITHQGRGIPDRLQQWVKYQGSLLTGQNDTLKPLTSLNIEQGNTVLNIRFAADLAQDHYVLLLSEQKRPELTADLLATLDLSLREAEVLALVVEGKTNAEIASNLHVSVGTVRKHLEHIYLRLGVTTRTAAVVAAVKALGLLSLD